MQTKQLLLQSTKGKYEKVEKIGEGAYGCVYKALNHTTMENVAVKKIKVDLENDGTPQTAIREISIVQSIYHPNIVPIQDVFFKMENKRDCSLYIVFKYSSFDLHKYTKKNQPFKADKIKHIMYQLLLGIESCHEQGVIHRDLKPQNILIEPEKNDLVQICDFGLARTINLPIKTLTHEVETLWYRAPEILLGTKSYSLGVDIWSAGCIFAELYKMRPLFIGDSEIDQIFKVFKILGTPDENMWPGVSQLKDFKYSFPQFKGIGFNDILQKMDPYALDLLKQMVVLNPTKRISAKRALKHPYFKDYQDQSNSSSCLIQFLEGDKNEGLEEDCEDVQ